MRVSKMKKRAESKPNECGASALGASSKSVETEVLPCSGEGTTPLLPKSVQLSSCL